MQGKQEGHSSYSHGANQKISTQTNRKTHVICEKGYTEKKQVEQYI
jgi:hypothetical protein